MTDRNTPTIEAPPPSDVEHDTMPPGAEDAAADRVMATMLPAARTHEPARTLSEPVKEDAIDLLLRMYQAAQDRETDLLNADGRLAQINDKRANRIKTETISELSQVVDTLAGKPVRELARKVGELASVVGKIQTEIEGVKGDVTEMRAELDALRLRVETQQQDLDATIERLDEAERLWNENAARAAQAPPITT